MDPFLKLGYRKIPKLPRYFDQSYQIIFYLPFFIRMADFAPAYGPRSENGGFRLSQVLDLFESPDIE